MIQINDTPPKLRDLELLQIQRKVHLTNRSSWFTLLKIEREIAVKYGIYYPTKYPFGFNWFASWYITRGLK